MADCIVESRYLSAGANRHAAAADWGEDGLVAYGSDANVCLWDPVHPRGISHILGGHTAHIRAVRFLPRTGPGRLAHLVTGGDDKQLRLWAVNLEDGTAACVQAVQEHAGPINCISAVRTPTSGSAETVVFATGATDATVKVWALEAGQVILRQTIRLAKRYIPLAVALSWLDEQGDSLVMAVAGTTNAVQIFTAPTANEPAALQFTLQATLSGHENWIRSLDFVREKPERGSDLMLSSASQDKYIRLWRIHQGTAVSALSATGLALSADALTPGNKIHTITAGGPKYSVMFQALLLGHEDWIYSARWSRNPDGRLQLLSASADNTLSVWESDPESGIWITVARLGEVSREKGATTATGSIGGFWTGLWSPSGTTVITLGRTGSWRRWDYDAKSDVWRQNFAVSGHTRAVTGISWSRDGSYLLSTSSDQTTRLHAEWAADPAGDSSWHEMSRPQIHGYDLNCISTLGSSSFVSGADEKLMRVFTEPKAVARMLSLLTRGGPSSSDATTTTTTLSPDVDPTAPDAANMPVLGLSNKAIDVVDDDADLSATLAVTDPANPSADRDAPDPASIVRRSALEIDHPPFEESLARHTLWPEVEKLYGHGYEISCLAASHDGRLVASACRASSLNHAVVRLFETAPRWTEVRPPLAAHTLTVTRLRFSPDDRFLLSVGRDRQWAVFERRPRRAEAGDDDNGSAGDRYELLQANPKGHTRMILDAAWAPLIGGGKGGPRVFATAGRDKQVKVWIRRDGDDAASAAAASPQFELAKAVAEEHPVTALDFVPETTEQGLLLLAVGTEAGSLSVLSLKVGGREVDVVSTLSVAPELCLPKTVMQLAWRPVRKDQRGRELAVAGEDGSLRIYEFPSL